MTKKTTEPPTPDARAPDPPRETNILDRLDEVPNIADARAKAARAAKAKAARAAKAQAALERAEGRGQPSHEPEGMSKHFRPLGYNMDKFYFMSNGAKQVLGFTPTRLSKKTELMMLAPFSWWVREWGDEGEFSGQRVDIAVDYLIRCCHSRGAFNPEVCRGRGVWLDEDDDKRRVVIHAGDRLYIDGAEMSLLDGDTTHVYEQAQAVKISMADGLTAKEGQQFLNFCKALHWENRTHGMLLAGLVVVAIASGALVWRPHGLITGPKGCGKSWAMSVLSTLMGSFCLSATGRSTAAGIRQHLRSDALPVLFDEAEGETDGAARNIEAVLALMRHSSSIIDAQVYKGGASGVGTSYKIRSCFILGAIRNPLVEGADKSRVTVLSLRKATSKTAEHWRDTLVPMAREISSDEYAERFRSRIFSRIDDLLQSIDVFRDVCAAKLGDQRIGDQVGTMIGGAWLMTQDGVPSLEEAEARVNKMDLSDQVEMKEEPGDEDNCFRSIMEAHVRVDGSELNGFGTKWSGNETIGKLVEVIVDGYVANSDSPITKTDAERTLKGYGIRVEGSPSGALLLISNTNGALKKDVMAHTAWPQGWGTLLGRLPGATKRKNVVRIGGAPTRVTAIPLSWPEKTDVKF